jgi:hypothetical protein
MADDGFVPYPGTGGATPPSTPQPDSGFVPYPTDDDSAGTVPQAIGTGILGGIPFAKDIAAATVPYIAKGLSYLPQNADQQKALAGMPQNYTDARARLDAASDAAYKAHPWVQTGSSLATGAATLPFAGPSDAVAEAVAPSLSYLGRYAPAASRAIGSGATSGFYGSLYGGSEGATPYDRASNALSGGAYGTALGAAAAPVSEGLSRGIGAAVQPFRNYFSPAEVAAERIHETGVGGPSAIMPQGAYNSAVPVGQPGGQPVMLGDLGTPQTQNLARIAANQSPTARSTLLTPLNERYATQSNRFGDFVSNLFGGNLDSQATRDQLVQNAKSINDPAYRAAYNAGSSGIMTPKLGQLLQSDEIQGVIPQAQRFADNYAAANGLPKPAPAFTQLPNGAWAPTTTGGSTQIPTLQFWDHIKQGLDSKIATATRAGDNQTAGSITGVKKALTGELDAVPGVGPLYAQARAGAFGAFQAQDALEAGENYLKTTSGPLLDQQNQALGNMAPQDKAMFSRGFARSIVARAQNPSDTRNLVTQFNNPTTRAKFQAGLDIQPPGGPPGIQQPAVSDQIEAYLQREDAMNKLRNQVGGNSTTTQQAIDASHEGGGEHGIVGQIASGFGPIGAGAATGLIGAHEAGLEGPVAIGAAMAGGSLAAILRSMASSGNKAVMENIAKQLTSSDPNVVNQALRRTAANPSLMNALRRANAAIPWYSGQPGGQQ